MLGKRSFVLILLAAILGMHGTPCLADNPAAGHAMTMGPAAAAAPLQLAAVATPLADTHTNASPEVDSNPSAITSVADDTPSHGSMVGAWAACLAVFLAGITAIAALFLGRRTRIAIRSLLDRGRTIIRRAAPPSPPDLSVLCLLRV